MVMAVNQENVDESIEELEKAGKTVYRVGSLVEREGEGCILKNLDAWD